MICEVSPEVMNFLFLVEDLKNDCVFFSVKGLCGRLRNYVVLCFQEPMRRRFKPLWNILEELTRRDKRCLRLLLELMRLCEYSFGFLIFLYDFMLFLVFFLSNSWFFDIGFLHFLLLALYSAHYRDDLFLNSI